MQKYIDQFLSHSEKIRGCGPATILIYRNYLAKFFAFSKTKHPSGLKSSTVDNFRSHLDSKNLNPKTKNLYLVVIRAFLRNLEVQQKVKSLSPSLVELYAKPKLKILELPTPDELKSFLASRNILLDDLVVNFLYDSGLRVAELCSLNLMEPAISLSVLGKGHKPRRVFLTEPTLDLWKRYLIERATISPCDSKALFVNRYGHRLTPIFVQRIVKRRAQSLGLKGRFTPHILRHLFATDILRNGAPLHDVQRFLGHSSLVSTQRYLHLTSDDLEKSYRKYKNG